ncbi:hypothetical protein V2J09_012274 [Rumex salicifolius]
MDLEKYLDKYNNVSREELKKIEDSSVGEMTESVFELLVRNLHNKKEHEKKKGRAAIRTRPLVHVLSVSVQPKNEEKPLAIYGRIRAEFCDSGATDVHELFNRERGAAQIILGTSNALTLTGPEFSCWPPHAITPSSTINVMLYDEDDNNVFANECFCLDDDVKFEDDYEEVMIKVIHCQQGSLTLQFIRIPFGVSGRISVEIYNRQAAASGNDHVNVTGKIGIRYANTYGNYVGEDCVLFEKQSNDFEQVKLNHHGKNDLKLSRCWVVVPAYSPLVIDLDLSEFETSRKILNNTIHLLPSKQGGYGDSFVQEEMDLLILVQVGWFSPEPFGRCKSSSTTKEMEEMDIEGEDDGDDEMDCVDSSQSSDDDSDDNLLSKRNLTPSRLLPHMKDLCPSPAVEIFSVFIGREKSKAIQIYGSVEILSDDDDMCYIFKRDEKDALGLQEHMKSTLILDGSRLLEDCSSLGIKFDIRDVEDRLAIRGYVDWPVAVLDSDLWHEKQLCSLIQGQKGFAAVHYSIFSDAVAANIKVFLKLKAVRGCVDMYPKVCGSLVTQYNCYDYSTRYSKDYYRIVLFRRGQEDAIQPSCDWSIPLSRSMVVVPSYSSLVVNVDLSSSFGDTYSGSQKLACVEEIEMKIGEGSKTKETDDCLLHIELDWFQIKPIFLLISKVPRTAIAEMVISFGLAPANTISHG